MTVGLPGLLALLLLFGATAARGGSDYEQAGQRPNSNPSSKRSSKDEARLSWKVGVGVTRVTVRTDRQSRTADLSISGKELARQVAQFRLLLADPESDYHGLARILCDLLVTPVAGEIRGRRRLGIELGAAGEGAGALWGLPFEALVMPDGRHLIEEFDIVYVLYAGLPVSSQVRGRRRPPRPRRAGEVLAMSGPAGGVGDTAESQGYDPEMRIWEESEEKVSILRGATASEEAFRELAPRAGIIHVALPVVSPGMAEVRPYKTDQKEGWSGFDDLPAGELSGSYIVMGSVETGAEREGVTGVMEGRGGDRGAGSGEQKGRGAGMNRDGRGGARAGEGAAGPRQDGRLWQQEVETLSLNAALVVLSGWGGMGRELEVGGGEAGMVSAFLSAGCHSVAINRWVVEPQRRAELLIRFLIFFRGNGMIAPWSPSAALRRAVINMMSDPLTSHPHYWAGFLIAAGDSESVR